MKESNEMKRQVESTIAQLTRARTKGQASNARAYRARLETLRARLMTVDPTSADIARITDALR